MVAMIKYMDYQLLWESVKNGSFCDMILIEKSTFGETKEYKVHKIIMCISTEYFKKRFNAKMSDSNTDTITIPTESDEIGLLANIIEAIYKPKDAKRLYYAFVSKNTVTKIMQLYSTCCYLGIDKHIVYIQKAIKELTETTHLVQWWSEYNATGKQIPSWVEAHVQERLRDNIKYIGPLNEVFISINILLALWPESSDPIAVSFKSFFQEFLESTTGSTKELQ